MSKVTLKGPNSPSQRLLVACWVRWSEVELNTDGSVEWRRFMDDKLLEEVYIHLRSDNLIDQFGLCVVDSWENEEIPRRLQKTRAC